MLLGSSALYGTGAGMDRDDEQPRKPPLVILNADRVFSWTKRPEGYSPALGAEMALAHCWAPYDKVTAALHSLAFEGLHESRGRDAARSTLRGLYQHPAPFNFKFRFPEGEVFLSVDHGVLGQCVYRILTELLRADAAGRSPGQPQMVDACEAFMKAVASAAAALDQRATAVLYDRSLFERAFGLTWTDR